MVGEASSTGRGWDPLVRLTHWGVAAAVLLNGIVTEEGSEIHVWVGYTAFALLALRLVWGLIGPAEARFSAFPPSLSAARAHISDLLAGRHRRHRSHNPLGALMAYALWATLALVTVTGIAMAGSPFAPRPADDDIRIEGSLGYREHGEAGAEDEDGEEDEGEEMLEEIHEAAANLLLILAALHVGGVALESRRGGGGLVRRMVTGGGRRLGGA